MIVFPPPLEDSKLGQSHLVVHLQALIKFISRNNHIRMGKHTQAYCTCMHTQTQRHILRPLMGIPLKSWWRVNPFHQNTSDDTSNTPHPDHHFHPLHLHLATVLICSHGYTQFSLIYSDRSHPHTWPHPFALHTVIGYPTYIVGGGHTVHDATHTPSRSVN